MRGHRIYLALLMIAAMWAAGGTSMIADEASGELPYVRHKPSVRELRRLPHAKVELGLVQKLGKAIFFDKNLSNPPGLSCASCHDPESGYSGSNNSDLNASIGIVPGAVPGRSESRSPPTISYAKYCPHGPPVYNHELQSYVGGFFTDGRSPDLITQLRSPLFHPNEMNNTAGDKPSPQLVVDKVRTGPYARLFQQVYGDDVFTQPTEKIFNLIAEAIVAFESSTEVSPFSSKYDAYLSGEAKLSEAEYRGLTLVTGSSEGRISKGGTQLKGGQCVICHAITDFPDAFPDLWTQYCYTNIGVPKNPKNPYYNETDKQANPLGYNALGASYVDLGLGDFLYPAKGLVSGNIGPGSDGKGDFLYVNGTFKVPTLRNVDKRPSPTFVKAYMHNGYFKSLKDVVHFYNTRNLTTYPGEVIDFTKPAPYADLQGKPLWPPPEYAAPATLQNAEGIPGRVGNLGLTGQEEDDIVAFLKTLSDGYSKP
jgi:cytochrome c peroxidase